MTPSGVLYKFAALRFPSPPPVELMTVARLEDLLDRLARSTFRSRFRLRGPELEYFHSRGLAVVVQHAAELVDRRLAAAAPPNDGKQTPYRKHPVFVAQHATATCCRGCLAKWHGIPRGRELTIEERRYVVGVLEHWLRRQVDTHG